MSISSGVPAADCGSSACCVWSGQPGSSCAEPVVSGDSGLNVRPHVQLPSRLNFTGTNQEVTKGWWLFHSSEKTTNLLSPEQTWFLSPACMIICCASVITRLCPFPFPFVLIIV